MSGINSLEGYEYLSQETQDKIEEYARWNPHFEKERIELESLIQNVKSEKHGKELDSRFLNRLQFGTAGIRGTMGCGYNRMNDLIVIQTTQGIATYLEKTYVAGECQTYGVVIGFDGRHASERYAHAAAAVFLSKRIKVYLTSEVVPTPLVPFTIKEYKCLAGIQITASHNPKDDNGYKVYAANGAQIIPPMDEDISKCILSNLKPWDQAISLLDLRSGLLCSEILNARNSNPTLSKTFSIFDYYNDMNAKYVSKISQELCLYRDAIQKTRVKFVYTPMHGVGYQLTSALVRSFGISDVNFIVVQEQCQPDPEFPTVKFPNPEEKGALDCSIHKANQVGASIILANDPDADRFACAEKQHDGTWKIFSGDELGLLFAAYAFQNKSRKVPKQKLLFLCSAVSSRMLERFAQVENEIFEETATGFKWIMNRAIETIQSNVSCTADTKANCKSNSIEFCFAYEEALGFALSLNVPDKDGISACAVCIEMISRLYNEGMTLSKELDRLYTKYGYSFTNNSYFICREPSVVRDIFKAFRNHGNYAESVGPFRLRRIRDVGVQFDNGKASNLCALPCIPGSEMITLYFENGVTITFRTSGTEPKLKFYSEIITDTPSSGQSVLKETLDEAIKSFLHYEQYKEHLLPPATQ